MNKKQFISMLIFFALIFSFIGCIETSSDNKHDAIPIVDINLAEVGLNESDLPGVFDLLYENHTTEPTTVENQTGNGLTWNIQERYDATYFKNLSNGVMQTILEIDTVENTQKLVSLSKGNLVNLSYILKENDDSISIGNLSYFLYFNYSEGNISYTYYTYLFSIHNIFVALGGSSPEESTFVEYAKIIEQNIISAIDEHNNSVEE